MLERDALQRESPTRPPTPLEMLNAYTPLARAVAGRKARANGAEAEDLFQAAMMGLWVAALRWSPERKVQFAAYARKYVAGYVENELDAQDQFGARKARDWNPEARAPARVAELLPSHTLSDPEESRRAEDRELAEWLVGTLKYPKQAFVIRKYYLEGLCSVTIAHQLGISRVYVNVLRNAALKAMRREAARAGLTDGPASPLRGPRTASDGSGLGD